MSDTLVKKPIGKKRRNQRGMTTAEYPVVALPLTC